MGETARAAEAFGDYFGLGATRSLRKLHAIYVDRHRAGDPVPTRNLSVLRGWCQQHEWQARIIAEFERAAQMRQEERDRALARHEEQMQELLASATEKIGEMLRVPILRREVRRETDGQSIVIEPVGWRFSDVLRAMQVIDKLQREICRPTPRPGTISVDLIRSWLGGEEAAGQLTPDEVHEVIRMLMRIQELAQRG